MRENIMERIYYYQSVAKELNSTQLNNILNTCINIVNDENASDDELNLVLENFKLIDQILFKTKAENGTPDAFNQTATEDQTITDPIEFDTEPINYAKLNQILYNDGIDELRIDSSKTE